MRSAPPQFNPSVQQPLVHWESKEHAQAGARAIGAGAGALGGLGAWMALHEKIGWLGAALPVLGAAGGYALWATFGPEVDVYRGSPGPGRLPA